MKNLIKIFAVVLMLAGAASAGSQKLAAELSGLLQSKENLIVGLKDGAKERVEQMQKRAEEVMQAKGRAITAEALKKQQCKTTRAYDKYMESFVMRTVPVDEMNQVIINTYANQFSDDQLQDMIDFYKTEVAQKAISGQRLSEEELEYIAAYEASEIGQIEKEKMPAMRQIIHTEDAKLPPKQVDQAELRKDFDLMLVECQQELGIKLQPIKTSN